MKMLCYAIFAAIVFAVFMNLTEGAVELGSALSTHNMVQIAQIDK